MSKNKYDIIILVGALCTSAAIWMLSDFPNALLFLGLFAIIYGISRAVCNE